MDTQVFLIVMAAAALHAGWNALVKIGLDRFLTASLIQIGAGIVALPTLPFLAPPVAAAWPWLALSALLHIGYNVFLVRAYQLGGLGQVYAISRGSSPLLATLLALMLLGESLTWVQLCGLSLLVTGIWLMALHQGASINRNLLLNALATATCIAGYSLADACGARTNGNPLTYSLWLFTVNALAMGTLLLARRGPRIASELGKHWRTGLLGGAMSLFAYSIVIWAMTLAPVAAVSALRETSVVFALLIGRWWLKEPLSGQRILACLLILAGAINLKIA
jgi:drug/metabolite transporter (DMT)-like permease